MEHFVDLLVGLAWPIATVWIAYLFRREIRGLGARISLLKYKELEARFEKGLSDAETTLQKVHQNGSAAQPKPERLSQIEQLRRIAEVSPRAAILEAWMLIEAAVTAGGLASRASGLRVDPVLLAEHLTRAERKIPKDSIELFGKLHQLRNQAAHLPDFALSQTEAERYFELAVNLSEILENCGNES